MATYLQGVTDFIPDYQPFQPDLNFYANLLQTKQTQYDTNWNQINNLYGQLYGADLTHDLNIKKKDELLKRIHAVPNPYYAVSEYEANRLESKIKIINLPEKATIKIYTLDGALVKTINKNDGRTNYVDWDLKNNKNIPIVSGMYLIHVDLPGIGETVVKWFGAMRPVDITNF